MTTAEADGRHEGSDPAGATQPGSARLLGITSLAHFLNDGVVFFVPVIGDLLSQDHRTSTVMVTAMLTTFYVVSAGFGIVVGLVADKMGRRGQMIAVGIASSAMKLCCESVAVLGVGADATDSRFARTVPVKTGHIRA